jgi:hypothetical protein
MPAMKDYTAQLVALAVFLFGLVAWRLQLLDKRRFEVAEQALIVHSKVTEALRVLRQRNSWKGFRDEWKKELGDDYTRYHSYRERRRWQYQLPDEKMKAFEDVYKELGPTVELTRLYLSLEAANILAFLHGHFDQVKQASYDLIRIEQPNDSVDPENAEPAPLDEAPPPFDDEEELTPEQEKIIEQMAFTIRFEQRGKFGVADDQMTIIIREQFERLQVVCKPYTNTNPYWFLWRLLASLFLPVLNGLRWCWNGIAPSK